MKVNKQRHLISFVRMILLRFGINKEVSYSKRRLQKTCKIIKRVMIVWDNEKTKGE